MIKYALSCSSGHEFEAWFGSGEAFDRQAQRRLVSCPSCGSSEVEKRPMAPAIISPRKERTTAPVAKEAGSPPTLPVEALRAFRNHILSNTEDVGTSFAEEARKIHHGESDARAIRGEASAADAAALHEEGVAFGVLPKLPEDLN